MVAVRVVALIVRFLVEVAMLAALAWAGATLGEGWTAWLLGLALPGAALAIWATFVAPQASPPVPLSARVGIELVLFVVTAIVLIAADQTGWAATFLAVGVATSLANAATAGIRTPLDPDIG